MPAHGAAGMGELPTPFPLVAGHGLEQVEGGRVEQIPGGEGGDAAQPRFVHNDSGRFECRFSSVAVLDSPSIMLR